MAFPETDPTRPTPTNSDAVAPASPRPSWEAARPAAAPRPAALPPRPAPTVAPAPDPAPYYRSPPPAPARQAPVYQAPAYQAPLDSDVKYDLAGNPIPGTGSASAALPGRIVYSGGEATGSWPPAPASPYGGWQSAVGDGTDRVAKLRWNWGAFLIPFWWSIFNGQRGLASVITLANVTSRFLPAPFDWAGSVVSLGISIYLGCMGHRLAWSSDRLGGDYDNFVRTQRAWMIWGFALLGVTVGAVVFFALMVPGFLAALGGAHPVHHHHHYGSYGSGSYGSGSSSNGDGSYSAPTN